MTDQTDETRDREAETETEAATTDAPAPGHSEGGAADPAEATPEPDRERGASQAEPAKPPGPPPKPALPVKEPEKLPVVVPSSWLTRRGYPLLGLCLLLIYLPTLARGATFSDGPELVSAIRSLGVAHPTGYPIFILVIHAFAAALPDAIPYILRVELFNALCGAGGAVLAAYTARALLESARRPEDDPRHADLSALVAAALLGLSPMLWQYLHIPEVYPLHFFLASWAGYLWMRFEHTRREIYIVAAALPMGLGLAHHVTMVYMLPAAVVYLLARHPIFFVAWITSPATRLYRRFKPTFREGKPIAPAWGFLLANVVGFLPLLSYYYLIWANNHSAGVPWGDVSGWDNLYNHFTGKQYQGFMNKLDLMGHLNRIKVIPDMFDQQFLPVGTVLFLSGIVVAFRRAWIPSLFFLTYLLLNAAHGAHYGVGDYGTYYIPGFYCCAIFMAPGLLWLIQVVRTRPPELRAPFGLAALTSMLITAAISIAVYARFTRRLPAPLAAHPLYLSIPLGLLALAAAVGAVVTQRRRKTMKPAPAWALPSLLAGGLLLPVVPAAIWRGIDISREPIIGEVYARELGDRIPPGAVLLTQGDGYLFSMWYANHVLDKGRDFVTLDAPNVRTPWFARYIKTHHPLGCDPLSPAALRDPAAHAARCDTFEKRLALKEPQTWIALDLVGNRKPYPGSKAATATVLRGNDARCVEKKFLDEHIMKECRCFGYGKRFAAQEGMLEEDCVQSAEEGGVVPREPVEIFTQRILEDFLDERPVFERNVHTRWDPPRDNPRGWEGPPYQRISAEYALLNRGRHNQIVYAADLQGFDPCGEALREPPIRASVRPRSFTRGPDRRKAYQPNQRPTLITASWLVPAARSRDDESTHTFAAGDPVWGRFDWFEKFTWDAAKPDKRGAPLHHAVRLCVFDPHGRRVQTRLVKSGPGLHDPIELLPAGSHEPGKYRLMGCTTGAIGADTPIAEADSRACAWPIVDYDFTVQPPR